MGRGDNWLCDTLYRAKTITRNRTLNLSVYIVRCRLHKRVLRQGPSYLQETVGQVSPGVSKLPAYSKSAQCYLRTSYLLLSVELRVPCQGMVQQQTRKVWYQNPKYNCSSCTRYSFSSFLTPQHSTPQSISATVPLWYIHIKHIRYLPVTGAQGLMPTSLKPPFL